MKAIGAIRRPLTPEKCAEIMKALREADKPFARQMIMLETCTLRQYVLHLDKLPERMPLPPEWQKRLDDIEAMRREMREYVLRSYGITLADWQDVRTEEE